MRNVFRDLGVEDNISNIIKKKNPWKIIANLILIWGPQISGNKEKATRQGIRQETRIGTRQGCLLSVLVNIVLEFLADAKRREKKFIRSRMEEEIILFSENTIAFI